MLATRPPARRIDRLGAAVAALVRRRHRLHLHGRGRRPLLPQRAAQLVGRCQQLPAVRLRLPGTAQGDASNGHVAIGYFRRAMSEDAAPVLRTRARAWSPAWSASRPRSYVAIEGAELFVAATSSPRQATHIPKWLIALLACFGLAAPRCTCSFRATRARCGRMQRYDLVGDCCSAPSG